MRGNYICRQGKPAKVIYFIRRGHVGLKYSWNFIYDKSPEARIKRIPNKSLKKTEFFWVSW